MAITKENMSKSAEELKNEKLLNEIDKIEEEVLGQEKAYKGKKDKKKMPKVIIPEKNEKIIQKDKEDIFKIFDAEEKKNDEWKKDAIVQAEMIKIGLSEEALKSMGTEGHNKWKDLSAEKKLLAIEQISQDTLSRVKEIGEKRFQDNNKINFKQDIKSPGALLLKIGKNITRPYWISKEEKDVLKEAQNNELEPNLETVKQIVDRTADMNLDVEIKNGKAHIVLEKVAGTPEEQEIIEKYNEAANQFMRMPDSWRNEKSAKGASDDFWIKKNHGKYQESKMKYEAVKEDFLKIKAERNKESGMEWGIAQLKAMSELNSNDLKINILQYLNTNPDSIKELENIRNESSFKRFINNENIWKGIYMGAGFGIRSLTVGTLGFLAAPITAGVIGGARARRKAGNKINEAFLEGRNEKTFMERKQADGTREELIDKNSGKGNISKLLSGTEINTKEVAGFVDADSQIQRIDRLLNDLKNEKFNNQIPKIISQINARVDYIRQKQEEGLINYGTQNSISLNYELMKKISEASTECEITKLQLPQTTIEAMSNTEDFRREFLLGQIMINNNEKFSKREAEYKNKEMWRGVKISATASVVGWSIRHLMHILNEDSVESVAKEVSEKVNIQNIEETESEEYIEKLPSDAEAFLILKKVELEEYIKELKESAKIYISGAPKKIISQVKEGVAQDNMPGGNVDKAQKEVADFERIWNTNDGKTSAEKYFSWLGEKFNNDKDTLIQKVKGLGEPFSNQPSNNTQINSGETFNLKTENVNTEITAEKEMQGDLYRDPNTSGEENIRVKMHNEMLDKKYANLERIEGANKIDIIEAKHGDGGIVMARNLQKKLITEYGEDWAKRPEGEVPDAVKKVLGKPDYIVAKDMGLYQPNEDLTNGSGKESAIILKGYKLNFNEQTGETNLIDKDGKIIKGDDLKMFDSQPKVKVEYNVPTQENFKTENDYITENNYTETNNSSELNTHEEYTNTDVVREQNVPKNDPVFSKYDVIETNDGVKHIKFNNDENRLIIQKGGKEFDMKFSYDRNGNVNGIQIKGSNKEDTYPYSSSEIKSYFKKFKLDKLDYDKKIEIADKIGKTISEEKDILSGLPKETQEYKFFEKKIMESEKEILDEYGKFLKSRKFGKIEIDEVSNEIKAENIAKMKIISEDNINKIFYNETLMKAWSSMKKTTSVEELMKMNQKGDLSDDAKPLISYLERLEKVTNLKPEKSDEMYPAEKVGDYIDRALKEAAKTNKLDQVKI